MTTLHIATKELPESIQSALRAAGYRSKDVAVEAREKVSVMDCGGDGYRAFVVLVDLATGRTEAHMGSWGGANIFNPKNAVDLDDASRAIHVGMAVIKGREGGTGPVMATVYLHPDNVAKLLPAGPACSARAHSILDTFGYTSSYRKQALAEMKVTPAEMDELVGAGLISRNKAGACQLTTAGKNARAAKPARTAEQDMAAIVRFIDGAS